MPRPVRLARAWMRSVPVESLAIAAPAGFERSLKITLALPLSVTLRGSRATGLNSVSVAPTDIPVHASQAARATRLSGFVYMKGPCKLAGNVGELSSEPKMVRGIDADRRVRLHAVSECYRVHIAVNAGPSARITYWRCFT